ERTYDQIDFLTATTLAAQLETTNRFDIACQIVARLLDNQPTLAVGVTTGTIWWRARRCEQNHPRGFRHLRDLMMPPPEKCRCGRLNNEGSAMFYGAASVETALAELKAQPDEYFH